MSPQQIILRPVISEKALEYIDYDDGCKYTFYVHPKANRTQVKDAIEQIFDVDVVKITTSNLRGKIKRMGRFAGQRPNRKKATVTLAAGQRIQQLEGLV